MNDRIEITYDDVAKLIASAGPLWKSPIRNYYLVRRNGKHVSAKSIVFTLSNGEGHKGNEAARALLDLRFPVHFRKRERTHGEQPWVGFHDEGLLIFDDEPKGTSTAPTSQSSRTGIREAETRCAELEKELNATGEFDPEDELDGRERTERAIVCRRGQQRFREELLRAYSNRCSLTDCDEVVVLEAAHILPYNGPRTNHVSNGLLLRSDVHILFDLGKIAVNSDMEEPRVVISPELEDTVYRVLAGKKLRLPTNPKAHPDKSALREHRTSAGL